MRDDSSTIEFAAIDIYQDCHSESGSDPYSTGQGLGERERERIDKRTKDGHSAEAGSS